MDVIRKELIEFGLKGSQLVELPIEESKESAYAIEVDKSNKYELWEHFNHIKSKTGFTPVVTTFWGASSGSWLDALKEEDLFMRFPYEGEDDTLDISPKAIIERSKTSSYSALLDEHNAIYSEDLVDHMEFVLDSLQETFGKSPSEKEILELMSKGDIKSYFEFEGWILKWQIKEERGLKQNEDNDSYLDWFNPEGQVEALILLPIQFSYDVLAYIHWFGAENLSTEASIAMLRHWNEAYGAELVAHYGTMLHLKTRNRPSSILDAFNLAKEQESFAPCTTALPGASLRDLTFALMKRDLWFLHERP
ncbi:DUF4253 domain-containing protein [Aliikangiella coralliicola]|uniref:DUF4253 domain-containing protein n=1 Tax=Aliikangiella coralliicola TaxID=2592383 RepID=A0A545UJW7_9GAMM|nr:DUF4253 domain-containing protein [Aliikangiella coralliicola]TQV89746.1 DUF4253 domain-containing protein [Aliikangiella coralliicola]